MTGLADREIEARKLAEAYIEYDDVDELAGHLEVVLDVWERRGIDSHRKAPPMSDLHLYVHVVTETPGSADRKLDQILAQLRAMTRQEITIMANLSQLQAQVEQSTSVERSAIVLLNGLAAKLDEAGTDPAKLAELTSSLRSGSDDLAAAITKNTPAAPV